MTDSPNMDGNDIIHIGGIFIMVIFGVVVIVRYILNHHDHDVVTIIDQIYSGVLGGYIVAKKTIKGKDK